VVVGIGKISDFLGQANGRECDLERKNAGKMPALPGAPRSIEEWR
jgi:hypothetical protein